MSEIIFLLLLILSLSLKERKEKIFNPFENAAEIKTKIWYDSKTKKELAAHFIVTKTYKKFFGWKRIVNEKLDYEMKFDIPLRLADGSLVYDTTQLPYIIK